MKEFKFPDVGEGIHEGEIVKWHVKKGDTVKEDDTLLDVETAKAIVQIPSPYSGTIADVKGKPGDTIHVGDILVLIGEKGEKPSTDSSKTRELKESKPKRKSVGVVGELKEAKDTDLGGIKALPAIRMLAKKLNVDLASITPTGQDQRITIQDVKKAAHISVSEENIYTKTEVDAAKTVIDYPEAEKVSTPLGKNVEIIPLKGVRKSISENMVKAVFGIPHVTHMDEADITHLVEVRNKEKEFAKKKGVHLTYLPFIIKAIIEGLKEHPTLNSTLEEKNERILVKKFYNIGIAIDTPDGLIVPNVKNADKKKVLAIAKEIFELADKTRNRTIHLDELQGGTFTITNYGAFGGIHATPIINPPEVANLGIGKIMDKPMVIDGEILIRKVLPLSLSFDHRVIDGAEAARFTNTVIKYLEDPDLWLVSI